MQKKKRKILFASPHTTSQVPCQRFRYEQYAEYLESRGYETTFSPILDREDYKAFYSHGHLATKCYIAGRGMARRFSDLLHASEYDIIFIQREAFQIGPAFFEALFSNSKARLIYDFDDAIWVPDVSHGNKTLAWMKSSQKTARIISMCDMIFAGNQYLFDFASQFNSNVRIIPTTIDTNQYTPVAPKRDDDRICIGWSGSITTIKHFQYAVPFLKKLKDKYGDKIFFKIIGDSNFTDSELGVQGLPWVRETEVQDLSAFDIGMMPLPNDDWARGKCGLKGLQFMALKIPTVMSPVGVNSEIIADGQNGFLATTEEEWVTKLSKLIDDKDLRTKLGEAGRQTVVERYSMESQKDNYVKYFDEVLSSTIDAKTSRSFFGPFKPIGAEERRRIESFRNYDFDVLRSFDKEWSLFPQDQLSPKDREQIFSDYFAIFPWDHLPKDGGEGVDVGCGSGRWASLMARRVRKLHCLDVSPTALDIARRGLRDRNNVDFAHASVGDMPFADNSLDFAYSLGVLHHLPDPQEAIKSIAAKLKPGAPILLYLYYSFDNRPNWYRTLWGVSDLIRKRISKFPSTCRYWASQVIAYTIYWPFARSASLLSRLNILPSYWPLSYYKDKKFYVMRTDSMDRFGTPLEKRFNQDEIREMLTNAGFEDVRFSTGAPYWVVVANKKKAIAKSQPTVPLHQIPKPTHHESAARV